MDLLAQMSKHDQTDSWAIWETDSSGYLTGSPLFPDGAALGAVHGNVVIVALNPGGTSPTTRRPAWSNFHAEKKHHNDHFLAHAFLGTPCWGAYMTDLHPDIFETRSGLVRPESELIDSSVEVLISKIVELGGVRTVICIGGRAHDEIRRRSAQIEQSTGIPRSSIVKITHYSGGQPGSVKKHGNDPVQYRALVHRELAGQGLNF